MTPDEFREAGKRVIDWVADYMERLDTFPVLSRAAPGEIAAMLPDAAPETGEGFDAILCDLDRVVLPGVTHWQAPGFFGYFPANSSPAAVLGDLVSSGLGVQGMLWSTSPACTEIETKVLDWLADMIGLPDSFTTRSGAGGGVIQGTASEAVLVAMLAARERAMQALGAARLSEPCAERSTPQSLPEQDCVSPPTIGDSDVSDGEHAARRAVPPGNFTAYCSSQAHSSVVKAAMISGVGRERIRLIDTDATLALDAAALAGAIETDRAAGFTPFFICATLGTTSSGAFDPLERIADTLDQLDGPIPWLHVDAAWAGAACVCPEHRAMLRGVDRADSFNFNPHKWLLTTFDCSAMWVRDRAPLLAALSITPEYLRNAASDAGEVIDYRDWQVPLGRRFRALKLWFVIRHHGVDGLREHIRRSIALAEEFEQLLLEDERFELACPRSLALVCFRLKDIGATSTGETPAPQREKRSGRAPHACPAPLQHEQSGDARTLALLDRINASGRMFLTHARLPDPRTPGHDRFVIRLAVGGVWTRREHVLEAWFVIQQLANEVNS